MGETEKNNSTSSLIANECSPKVARIFGQYKKPFNDGVVVKECTSAVAETSLEGKRKQKFSFSKIKYFILKAKKQFFHFHYFMFICSRSLP